ncbi:helix-turn-helix domain-containing protein [Actinacidiphila sp. bgisy144]|uniref:helix-turn-helix domain-containing protein n=1 Tax=Actinacidiphila sp. bgisy144 TaxID=3413791 RepID=UPI003EB7E363
MTSTPLSAAEKRQKEAADLRAMYDAGASTTSLEREFRLSHGTVINRLRQAGVVIRTREQTTQLKRQARRDTALDLRARYEHGATPRDLAARSGHTKDQVRQLLAEAGTDMRPRGHHCQDPADIHARELVAAALRTRYEHHQPTSELADLCHLPVNTVYRWLRQAGTTMRSAHRPPTRKS